MDGKVPLPDLHLEAGEACEAVRALVGSGKSVHAVGVEQVVSGAKVSKQKTPSRRLATACGGTVPDLGSAQVPFRTADGHKFDIEWRNAPVAMPILSIRRVAARGARATFWKGGGEILFSSGIKLPIVERLGV